jgi:caffeoyl-CoA O-methyltransferase
MIIADNVLWSGKVTEVIKSNDKETKAIVAFNTYVQNHPQLDNLLLPFRDGLMVMRVR